MNSVHLTIVFLLVSIFSLAQDNPVLELPDADARLDVKFNVVEVRDERNDINNNGYTIANGRRLPVAFKGSVASQIRNHLSTLLPSGNNLLPVIVAVKKLHLTERNSGSTRITKTEMTLEFLRNDNGDHMQLLELNTWIEQGGGKDTRSMQEKNITDIIRKMALQFNETMTENSNDPLFAISYSFKVRSSAGNAESDTLYWQPGRKLKWSDFKAKEGTGDFAAQSNCAFAQDIDPVFENNSGTIYITVRAAFLKQGSWVKKGQTTAYILNHEQMHFNIAELHVRKLRKTISEANLSLKNYEDVITKMYNSAWDDYNAMQSLYDLETRHGTVEKAQEEWNKRIEKGLAALNDHS